MPVKLQIAVSRASLIFQKRFPDAVNTLGRLYIASIGSTRSHIATTKQKIIIPKIWKHCPLKSSYVAPRDSFQEVAPGNMVLTMQHCIVNEQKSSVYPVSFGNIITLSVDQIGVNDDSGKTFLSAFH